MTEENLKEGLKIEQLADLREKTELVSQLLLNQLKGHLDTLRPLLAPRRILGNYVRSSVREVLVGKKERRQEEVRQFLLNAIVIQLVLAKFRCCPAT